MSEYDAYYANLESLTREEAKLLYPEAFATTRGLDHAPYPSNGLILSPEEQRFGTDDQSVLHAYSEYNPWLCYKWSDLGKRWQRFLINNPQAGD